MSSLWPALLALDAAPFERPPKREASGPTRRELAEKELRRKRNKAARKARKRSRRQR